MTLGSVFQSASKLQAGVFSQWKAEIIISALYDLTDENVEQ